MARKKLKTGKILSPREKGTPTLKAARMVSSAASRYRAGQFAEAAALCRGALERCPEHADAMHLLGLSISKSGELEAGASWVRKALDHQPGNPDLHFSLGNILCAQGKLEEAIASLETVTTLKPEHGDAYYNLGNLYLAEREYRLAAMYFEQALQRNRNAVGAWHNRGVALAALGRTSEARDCYERAITLNPGSAASYGGLGMLLKGVGDLPGALICFKKAADAAPDFAASWINLGNIYLEMPDLDLAQHAFERALRLAPELPEAQYNLANLHQARGELAAALERYQDALRLKPDYPAAVAQLYYQARQACDWSLSKQWAPNLDAQTGSFLEAGRCPGEMPFINLIHQKNPGRNLAVARAWSREVAGRASGETVSFPHESNRGTDGRITIGYLSRDFRNHPVGLLVARMLACHDRNRFRVFGYAYGPDDSSDVRKKIRDGCDRFAEIGKLSTTASAQKIFDDDVDILVDLTGHTRGNRIDICALRPAPVQVSYLGFLGSSGAEFMDYMLTDRIVTPPDQADAYTEKFVYLPDSFMATDNTQPVSEGRFSRRDFGLPEKAVVFCSFNNAYKIDPDVFGCWMRILKQVPDSVLWLFAKDRLTAENLKREAVARDISPDRLIFAEKMPLEKHLARLKLADLALDTWCYNGGATTVNALWAGVPVVTLTGGRFVSRMSASCLMASGLPELITDSSEAYELLLVRLAANPEELSRVRRKLEENRLGSALFDTNRFTVNLERAYTKMWALYLSGEKPEMIDMLEK